MEIIIFGILTSFLDRNKKKDGKKYKYVSKNIIFGVLFYCYSCYSCCLVKAGAGDLFFLFFIDLKIPIFDLKMAIFHSQCCYQILRFDDINFFYKPFTFLNIQHLCPKGGTPEYMTSFMNVPLPP